MPCAFHMRRREPFDDQPPGCQFNAAAGDLIAFDGKHWCRFHLPLTNEKGEKSEKADWDERRIEQFNNAILELLDSGNGDFSGVVFRAGIDFGRDERLRNHKKPVCFARAVFGGDAKFDEVKFEKGFLFSETNCAGQISCRSTSFHGVTSFDRAIIRRDAVFMNANFQDDAGFRLANFLGRAWFQNAQFQGSTWFSETKFHKEAWFNTALFEMDVAFVRAQFRHDADFSAARFGGGSLTFGEIYVAGGFDMTGAANASLGAISFSDAVFEKSARFNNRNFTSTTSFRNATFGHAPAFHNATLHQDTDFTGAQFLDVDTDDAVRNFRTLRLAMEEHRARDEQAMFVALEQKARRRRADTPRIVKFVSWLYEKSSDYGQSLEKPLVGLLLTTALFVPIYGTIAINYSLPVGPPLLGEVFGFSVEQVFRPFVVWGNEYAEKASPWVKPVLRDAPLLFRSLAAVQTIASIGLIAVFLVALRRRFRLG